jgi:thiol:disulfide interchange protein DsbA
MKKLLLAFAAVAVLSGCGQKSTSVDSETATAPPPPAADAGAQPEAAAPTEAELDQRATAAQESTEAPPATTPADTSLERMVAMPENAQLPGGRWKAGTHYRPIVPAQPTNAGPGEVEVIEFVWLACGSCYALNQRVTSWKGRLPEWVKFRQEHVMWGPAYRGLARLLYTLEALKRPDLVAAAFDEIHQRRRPLAANSDEQTLELQLAFAKANGVAEADFRREYNGFAVNTRLRAAEELTRRYRIEHTPVFIVNGKYMTDVEMAGDGAKLLELVSDLAAFEKR